MLACTKTWACLVFWLKSCITSHHATHAKCLRKKIKCHGDTFLHLISSTIFSCSVFMLRAAAFSSLFVQHAIYHWSATWPTVWRWELGNRTSSAFRISLQFDIRGNGKSDSDFMSLNCELFASFYLMFELVWNHQRCACSDVIYRIWSAHRFSTASFYLSFSYSDNP